MAVHPTLKKLNIKVYNSGTHKRLLLLGSYFYRRVIHFNAAASHVLYYDTSIFDSFSYVY
jgi:hypothetical protein